MQLLMTFLLGFIIGACLSFVMLAIVSGVKDMKYEEDKKHKEDNSVQSN